MITILHKVNPETNARRFYRVAVEETLLGDICLTRMWGRIGGKQQAKAPIHYASRPAADMAAGKLIRRKIRGGYVVKVLENE